MRHSRTNRFLGPAIGVMVFGAALALSLATIGTRTQAEQRRPAAPSQGRPTLAVAANERPDKAAERAEDVKESDALQAGDPLFKNWPKPEGVIVATGMQRGYLEPCGCSGRENQKGGLSRRHNLIRKLVADGWTVLPVDVGGQIDRYGKQAEFKFQATVDALKTMHYKAVALGVDDLRLPAETLTAAVVDVDKDNPSPFVSANAALFGFDQQFMPRLRILKAGKLKVGVTAILGDAERKAINSSEIQTKGVAEALKEVLPELLAAKCDHLLLLAHSSRQEAIDLAKQFPQFDLIVISNSAALPPRQPELAPGTKTRLIEIGEKGMAANVIGLFDDPNTPLRFQAVPLDARFDKIEVGGKVVGPSEDMKQMLASYQDQLKLMGLAGLNIKPVANPKGVEFVGAKTCGECHTKAYAIWEKTPHAHALATLEKQTPPRQYDPECLSCHVTGWSPQRFYPFKGGFVSRKKTPDLADNGCENCHGPGAAHVAAENGKPPAGQDAANLRASIRVTANAKACIQCHDGDNSINFNFDTYWPKVVHKGKD